MDSTCSFLIFACSPPAIQVGLGWHSAFLGSLRSFHHLCPIYSLQNLLNCLSDFLSLLKNYLPILPALARSYTMQRKLIYTVDHFFRTLFSKNVTRPSSGSWVLNDTSNSYWPVKYSVNDDSVAAIFKRLHVSINKSWDTFNNSSTSFFTRTDKSTFVSRKQSHKANRSHSQFRYAFSKVSPLCTITGSVSLHTLKRCHTKRHSSPRLKCISLNLPYKSGVLSTQGNKLCTAVVSLSRA